MFCVVYCCDNDYVGQAAASIYSLYENNKSLGSLDVFIFGDSFSSDHVEKLNKMSRAFGRKLTVIESRSIIERIKANQWKPNVDNSALSTYVRLYLADELPEGYDRIIYIDSDTIILKPIDGLDSYADEKPLACAIDITSQKYKSIIGFGREDYYFNCGVMVYNTKLWRERDCQKRIMGFALNAGCGLEYADQDIINIVLKGEIEPLPLKYDVFPYFSEARYDDLLHYMDGASYYSKEEYEDIGKDKAIIHLVYSVHDRPWMKGNTNPYSAIWLDYLDKSGFHVQMKERKWYSRTRMLQYVNRFLGPKAALAMLKRRSNKKYLEAAERYKKAGICFG